MNVNVSDSDGRVYDQELNLFCCNAFEEDETFTWNEREEKRNRG